MPESKTPTGRWSMAADCRGRSTRLPSFPLVARKLLAVVVLALALPASASAWTKSDEVVTMPDGIPVATTLYLPDGAAPAAGWPAIVMAHGLGGNRSSTNALAEQLYVPRGYVVLTYDARGHGASGGVVDVDGPAEIADLTIFYERLRARPDVKDDAVGGWGISYGGGAMLRTAGEGVPWAALSLFETWSDLYSALFPQDLPKSGVILGFLSSIARPSPLIAAVRDAAVSGTNLAVLRQESAARSSRQLLSRVRVPTFWAQGKRDYAFDLTQATSAYALLQGPKRLWLGNLGHAPSTFPSDDFPAYAERSVAWYDRFLKGLPTGAETRAEGRGGADAVRRRGRAPLRGPAGHDPDRGAGDLPRRPHDRGEREGRDDARATAARGDALRLRHGDRDRHRARLMAATRRRALPGLARPGHRRRADATARRPAADGDDPPVCVVGAGPARRRA